MPELFDTFEAASKLKVSRQALAKWRVAGDGPPFIRCGAKILYRRSDIEDWLNARTASSTTEADAKAMKMLGGVGK